MGNATVIGRRLTLLALAWGVGLAACAGPVPTSSPAPPPTSPTAPLAPEVAWHYAAGQPLTARVAAGQGLVLVAPGGAALVALAAADGQERWRYDGPVHPGSVLVTAERVFAGAPGGRLVALDTATGAVLWETALTGELIYPPALSAGALYLGTSFVGPGLTPQPERAGRLYAFRAADGAPRWELETGCYLLATPAVDGDLVVAGGSFPGPAVDEGGHLRLLALRPADGQTVWRRDSTHGLLKSLVLDAQRVYYLAYWDQVFALDRATGDPQWTYDTENWSPGLTLADGRLYFGSDNAFVHALDAAGERLWRIPLDGTFNAPRGAPLLAGDQLYFQGADRALYALDQATGALIWQTPPQAFSRVNLTLADGWLYLTGFDNVVYAYRVGP